MLKKIFVLMVFTLFLVNCKIAEDVSNTWLKIYNGQPDDHCSMVLDASGESYYLVGGINLSWEPERQGDVYLFKVDSNGDMIWEKTYGGGQYDSGCSITETHDNNLLIGAQTMSFGSEGIDVYLIKTDLEGNEIWSKTFGGPLNEHVRNVIRIPDGGYMVFGVVEDPNDVIADAGAEGYGGLDGRSNIYMAKINNQGNLMWSKRFVSNDNVLVGEGIETGDGGFLIAANIDYFPNNDNDILLLKVDQNGQEVWHKKRGGDIQRVFNIKATPDGNFLMSGAYAPAGETDFFRTDFLFVKVDPNGNQLWNRIYGSPSTRERAVVGTITSDGGYVAAGGSNHIRLIRLDTNGQRLWENVINIGTSETHNGFASIIEHQDGGYLIGGVLFGNESDIFLAKTDSSGQIEE